jgi:hypothetical protein
VRSRFLAAEQEEYRESRQRKLHRSGFTIGEKTDIGIRAAVVAALDEGCHLSLNINGKIVVIQAPSNFSCQPRDCLEWIHAFGFCRSGIGAG